MKERKPIGPRSEALAPDDVARYSRQILLPEVGGAGQEKLGRLRALCVGVGGLGSPAALYLAAAGVGTIGLLDDDPVDLTNLQRQILHTTDDVGRPKVTSGKNKLLALNPGITVNVHRLRLSAANALDVFAGYDVVLDGSDNFPTRYLVNDACVLSGKTLVSGAVLKWEGQLFTVLPRRSACYRCLFPEPPVEGAAQSCAEAGVIGSAAGAIGSLQAAEAIKWALGLPGLAADRLISFDFARLAFRERAAKRDPACEVCGEKPTRTKLSDAPAAACRA